MTAKRSAASLFAPLLAGGLLFLAAGCGFDGEDDDWMAGENANPPANGSAASQPRSSTPSPASSGNASGTRTQANAPNNAAGDNGGNNNAGSGSSGANGGNAANKPAATGGNAGNAGDADRPGTGTTSATDTSAEPPAGGADGVPFSALRWNYGHFGGGRARLSSPQLANLRCSGNTLSYTWVKGLSGWGLSNGEAGAIAAAFVQKADGSWVGGKFDWVSSSRSSRGLENVLAGYDGWSLAGVPNPCQICFVVVDVSGRRRSNVIGPATWSR